VLFGHFADHGSAVAEQRERCFGIGGGNHTLDKITKRTYIYFEMKLEWDEKKNTKNMKTNTSTKSSGTDWAYLESKSDKEIDFSDIPKLDAAFWDKATLKMPQKKDSVTMRLDHDVLVWFREMGQGYQTKINAVLRSYMTAIRHA